MKSSRIVSVKASATIMQERIEISLRTGCFTEIMAQTWPSCVMKQLILDLSGVDHRDYLGEITQPMLILHGLHERKNRYEGSRILADLLPQAELIQFLESAHALFFEERDLFNRTVAEFIRR